MMKRLASVASISIILGILVSWLERAVPLFNLGAFNAVDITFAFFLLSLFVVLLVSSFSGNMLNALLSVVLYIVSYAGVCFYLGVNFDFPLLVRLGIILVSGIWLSLFLYRGKAVISKYPKGIKVRRDIAFPLIFFFASILFALSVSLMEENVILFDITKIFYGYVYFLVAVLLLFAFLSFNEVVGFLIGLVSLPVYFLSMRLIRSNFDFKFLIANEREFLIIVGLYSLLFAFATALMGRSGRVFSKGVAISLKVRSSKIVPSSGNIVRPEESGSKTEAKQTKENKTVSEKVTKEKDKSIDNPANKSLPEGRNTEADNEITKIDKKDKKENTSGINKKAVSANSGSSQKKEDSGSKNAKQGEIKK